MMNSLEHGSFRDPNGYIFRKDSIVYRQINQQYAENYNHLMSSGLYNKLVDAGLLISHAEVSIEPISRSAFKVIKPNQIWFISYPYEWTFSQLKDAAIATLTIQNMALDHGMTLKDATAYNIQFHNGKPVFIDTLSFELYDKGKPWIAYKQFCEHFLAPLALISYRDIRLNQLLRSYLDGIPLDMASLLLPGKTKFSFGLSTHIHMHAASQAKHAGKAVNHAESHSFSGNSMRALIDSLKTTVESLRWNLPKTVWGDYYSITNYNSDAFDHKLSTVEKYIDSIKPANVWDLGGNDGTFSRLAAKKGIPTLSSDIDPVAVEKNYITLRKNNETNLLPLLIDLTNPSPAIGWANKERQSFWQRGPADTILALAIIHHLAIANNLPLTKIASLFASQCKHLIIEFVPKSDSQSQRLLASREDIFPDYTEENFEDTFSEFFTMEEKVAVKDSERKLYLFVKR